MPSSKNSKVWTGKFLVSSKLVTKWTKLTKMVFESERDNFLRLIEDKELPLRIRFTFVRDSRRKFDYINPLQTIQDAMVRHKWISDDNCDIMIPEFGLYSVDKDNPGVWIEVL